MTSALAEKWRRINCFFSPGNRCSPTGPDPENRVGDQDIGSPCRPVSSGFQAPSELGHCHARTRPPLWPPAARHFSFKMSFNCQRQQRWVILRIDSLVLWKIINEEDAVLIPKNRGENFSNGFLQSEFFGAQQGRVSRYGATPLIVALSPGFVHGHQSWQETIWIAPSQKNSKVTQMTGTVDVFHLYSGISKPTWRRTSASPNLHEWWTQPAHVRCPVAQLLI